MSLQIAAFSGYQSAYLIVNMQKAISGAFLSNVVFSFDFKN
jgi:hypothetical protein